jgi:hypothetical protein
MPALSLEGEQMSYKRMKAFDKNKNFVGYLSCAPDFTTQQAKVTDINSAYKYNFVTFAGIPEKRLDQQTDGGDRSLTYGSLGVFPCWGLGANWIYVNYEDSHKISFNYGDQRLYLGRSIFDVGQWSSYLQWLTGNQNDGVDWQILSFDFDEEAEGVQA